MKEVKGTTKHVLHTAQNFKYVLIMEGILTGLAAGLIAACYRIFLDHAEEFIVFMSGYLKEHVIAIAAWFLFLMVLAFIVSKLLQWDPLISGSGIPQVEGEMMSFLDQKWYRILPAKMLGGVCCALGGLSLGREGPSIQLGAMAGKAIAKIFHRVKMEERLLLTCGAAAGLSAAFSAPLAGVMFALEEIHKNFSVSVLVSVMCASVSGVFLAQNIFGLDPAFHFVVKQTLPLSQYWVIILLGMATGLFGILYNKSLLSAQKLFDKVTFLKGKYRVVLPFLMSGVLILWLPQVLCGGHMMIEMISDGEIIFRMAIVLLVVKLVFSQMSFGSGAPGGIFFPMLVMGSFVGIITGMAMVELFGLPEVYMENIIIMSMAGTFAAVVRAPITGIVLIAEMSGTLTHLLPLTMVSLTSYLCASLLKCEPIYESLLHKMLVKNGVDTDAFHGERHLVEVVVSLGSMVCDKRIADISWPNKSLIITIERSGKEIIPRGDTVLRCGDTIMTLLNDEDAPYIQHELEKLCNGDEL